MNQGETLHFLPAARSKIKCNRKTFKLGFCISGKVAYVIMMWHFAVLLSYKSFYNYDSYVQVERNSAITYFAIAVVIFSTIAAFSPLIGILADIKLSRYRTVLCNSYFILVQTAVTVVVTIAATIVLFILNVDLNTKVPQYIKFAVILFIGIMAVPYIVFLINGFHFAMDQLLNSSADELVKFIHWYVWANYDHTDSVELIFLWQHLLQKLYYDVMHIFGISMLELTLPSTDHYSAACYIAVHSNKKESTVLA